MRVLLWLFAAPTAALLALSLTGLVSVPSAVGAALASQAAAYPCWYRLERRRMLGALRRRHAPGVVGILRGRHTRGEWVAQVALRAGCALAVAAAFLLARG